MRGPAARFLGIALAAAGLAAAAPVAGSPVSVERYEDGLAAYQRSDFANSLRLLRPLAERGDARAQYLLGRHHQFGQGVKVNRGEAFYWYQRAEAKGHLEAKLFRQLLEKRWRITAEEKAQAERKLAAGTAPKPAPRAAHAEVKPNLAKPAPETAAVKEKPKLAAAKPKVETARAKLPDPPRPAPARTKVETEKMTPSPEKSAVVATRSTPRPEESAPTVLRGRAESARAAPRTNSSERDDEEEILGPRWNGAPPAETRTPVAAAPTPPTSNDEDAPPPPPTSSDEYAPPPTPTYTPPSYTPTGPYYGPVPYYAPAAPPTWRASIYYGPVYRPAWGYRPYAGYMHPGWRGAGWRGYRSRW